MLAIALVAAAIQMSTPDYAGMRPGRIDAGYLCFKGKKAGALQETMGFSLGTCDCPALGEDILCVKRLNCFPAGSHPVAMVRLFERARSYFRHSIRAVEE